MDEAPQPLWDRLGLATPNMWLDPANEIIGVFLSVAAEFDLATFRHSWDVDMFQNTARQPWTAED